MKKKNIIVNINSFGSLHISGNTTLKNYHKKTLNKKLKLMGEAMTNFSKKLLSHKKITTMVCWVTNFFIEKFVKPSGSPSHILNLHSLI